MSRPKPNVMLEYLNKKTYKIEQILKAEAIWIVAYNNTPFNLRSMHSILNTPAPKYKKTSFSNPGHAYNLAKKLNNLFETDNFTVIKIENF